MGYQLRMSGEIHDWLAELRTADPARARLVAEALAALAAGGASLGPPLVRPADPADPGPAEPDLDPRLQLDQAYQDQLDQLAAQRRRVAGAATLAREALRQGQAGQDGPQAGHSYPDAGSVLAAFGSA